MPEQRRPRLSAEQIVRMGLGLPLDPVDMREGLARDALASAVRREVDPVEQEKRRVRSIWPTEVVVEECELQHPERSDSVATILISDREIRCHGYLLGVSIAPMVVRFADREGAQVQYARELEKMMRGGLRISNPQAAPAAREIAAAYLRMQEAAVRRALGGNPLRIEDNAAVPDNASRAVAPPLIPLPSTTPSRPPTDETKKLDDYMQPGKRRLL